MAQWYEVISGSDPEQGDIISAIDVLVPLLDVGASEQDGQELSADVETAKVIVLSQTCDLVHSKLDYVLLAQVIVWSDLVAAEKERGNAQSLGKKFRRKLIEGAVPNFALLHEHSGDPTLEWSVVNFRRLYTLPVDYVAEACAAEGGRLRMLPPYREHVAQGFAKFMMRVGLPVTADDFEAYEP